MEKVIKIGEKEVNMKATGATPRLYRIHTHRDLISDMYALEKKMKQNEEKGSEFAAFDLELFEQIAFIMARQGDASIPKDIIEWLDGFEFMDIYEVLPQIVELWKLNMETQIESKKNLKGVIEK